MDPYHPHQNGCEHNPDHCEVGELELANYHPIVGQPSLLEEESEDNAALPFDLIVSKGIFITPHLIPNPKISAATAIPETKKHTTAIQLTSDS